jgi:phosphoribosylformimino-5-aminoimidazole carboxamide ribotide isomerase
MMQGPAVDLYSQMVAKYPEQSVIASGGVSCYQDLKALEGTGVTGAIVGKAIYEGKITLTQLAEFSNAD